jgi:hypothetical protein
MLILFAIALTLGLLWMLSTTAWGRLRRLQATEFATPPRRAGKSGITGFEDN